LAGSGWRRKEGEENTRRCGGGAGGAQQPQPCWALWGSVGRGRPGVAAACPALLGSANLGLFKKVWMEGTIPFLTVQ
jgi:hypothetical protein